jgi:hypothetical protein
MFGTTTKTSGRADSWNDAPCGFQAGDANLRRYVGNDPTNAGDPSGLIQAYPSGPPDGKPVGNPTDLSGKLNPASIKFGSGMADITVTTQDYNQGGNIRKYIKVMVKTQNRQQQDINDMQYAHWVQIIEVRAVNAQGKPDVFPYFTQFVMPNQTLMTSAESLPVLGLPGLPVAGLSYAAAYFGVGEGNIDLYHSTDGTPELDAGGYFSLYYDEGATHERDETSLAIYDAPKAAPNALTPKIEAKATDYLILRGKVLYQLTWTQTTEFAGQGNPPKITYDIVGSGVPIAAGPRPDTLQAGYLDKALKQPLKLPNPLKP